MTDAKNIYFLNDYRNPDLHAQLSHLQLLYNVKSFSNIQAMHEYAGKNFDRNPPDAIVVGKLLGDDSEDQIKALNIKAATVIPSIPVHRILPGQDVDEMLADVHKHFKRASVIRI